MVFRIPELDRWRAPQPRERQPGSGPTRLLRRAAIAGLILAAAASAAPAGEPSPGRTLISPLVLTVTRLVDLDGTVLQVWHGAARPAMMAYLLGDGSIVRPCVDPAGQFDGGGAGGRIQRIDDSDTVVWDYYFSSYEAEQHHDVQPLPDGNVLLIAWERKTLEEAQAMGRIAIEGEMWPTLIVEVEPVGATGGNVVWEWHVWDHLIQDVDPAKPDFGVVAEHPELLDINFGVVGPTGGDWLHVNAIDYHEQFDQIVFSSRKNSEVYVIDHSTTTEEAAGHSGGLSGHGGDFLYRWGNPQAYGRGTPEDQRFFVAHGANWIDPGLPGEGHLLVFNNGDRPGVADDYSTAEEFIPPVDSEGRYTIFPGEPFGPSEPVWVYGGPGGFYGGGSNCGAFRMANGNTLLCHADEGYLFEVTESGEMVWDYDQPVGGIARADRYADSSAGVTAGRSAATALRLALEGPNPFQASTRISLSLERPARVRLEILDVTGRRIRLLHEGPGRVGRLSLTWDGTDDSGHEVPAGAYFIRADSPGGSAAGRVVRVTAGR